MEKARPVRNSHTSTAGLLSWSEVPPPSSTNVSRSDIHPSDGIGKVLFGGQITDEEAKNLNTSKSLSGYKLKEMSGSNIFSAGTEVCAPESTAVYTNVKYRTSVRIVQQGAKGKSQISFGTEEKISPNTLTSPIGTVEQHELSGTQERESDIEVKNQLSDATSDELSRNDLFDPPTVGANQHELSRSQESKPYSKVKKQLSDAKSKELSGNDIFGPPLEVPPRSLAPKESKNMDEPAPRGTVRTSVKVSNPAGGKSNILFSDCEEEPVVKTVKKINNQKLAELSGNGIFKGDSTTPPGSSEKSLSKAKLREMSGSNIFSDAKVESRGYFPGVRKPPGGDSSIKLG